MKNDGEVIRFKLTIAYDGTGYAGWQLQKNAVAVQQRVEEALQKLFPGVTRVHSSSRTDTGVHAMGMAAHVDIPQAELKMDERQLLLAANSFLPEDIRVNEVKRVKPDFHARFDAKKKQYRYVIWNHPAMNPLLRNRAWQVTVPLDFVRMQKAAKLFVGRKDFQSFASAHEYKNGNHGAPRDRLQGLSARQRINGGDRRRRIFIQNVPRHRGHAGASGPAEADAKRHS